MKAKVQFIEGIYTLLISKEGHSSMLLLEWLAYTRTALVKVIDTDEGILKIKIDGTNAAYKDACEYINNNL